MTITKNEEIVKQIATTYFISMRYLHKKRISSGDIDIFSPFYKYYKDVELAFCVICFESKRIITNEYFYDGYANWWMGTYKLREFKRKKKIALKEFVEAFYEIH